MKLYIWEGDGISGAYHDDGTLVVLASSAEEARAMVRAERARGDAAGDALRSFWVRHQGERVGDFDPMTRAEWEALGSAYEEGVWDGSHEALDREPDRTIDVVTPCIVAFNGGGYD